MSSRRAHRTGLGSRLAGTSVFCWLHSRIATFVSVSSASLIVHGPILARLVSYKALPLPPYPLPPPFSPSLISLAVSVDVKHHVYLLTYCFTSTEATRLIRDGEKGGKGGVWKEWGREIVSRLSLHCHHRNDLCTKVGSDERHFNVS